MFMGQQQPPAPQVVMPTAFQLPQFDINAFEQIQDPNQRREMIGNTIYPIVNNAYGQEMAGRITGMVIDQSPDQIR